MDPLTYTLYFTLSISKRELADNLDIYGIEDLNHLKIDSLEEQEQINAIKAAVYVIYCVLEVSSD